MVAASANLLSPKGVNYEATALMAVMMKLKDELNVMNGWDINSVDPCTWNMVACSTEDIALCGGPGGLVPMPTTQIHVHGGISRAGLSNDFEMLWATAGYATLCGAFLFSLAEFVAWRWFWACVGLMVMTEQIAG
nr:putative lrr receptor-like serine/threonine-protein kinase [Quercus suber]